MNRGRTAHPRTSLERRLDPLREPFREFVRAQTTSGFFLLLALVAALLLYNLGGHGAYEALRHLQFGLHVGGWQGSTSLLHLTNDGLITVFFFLIGLEIKRELLVGELQDPARLRMLVFCALGGMALPALIYSGINLWMAGGIGDGWGIPMATDTALAIGILAVFSKRLPAGAAAFLVGLAIVDDMGAVIVIALFYTDAVHLPALLSASGLLGASLLLNYAGVRHPVIYAGIAVLVWLAVRDTGIHASIAGVLTAATVPARPRIPPFRLLQRLHRRADNIDPEVDVLADQEHHERIESLADEARAATTPLRRWEGSLDLPVALLILPLFVFVNAGVPVSPNVLAQAIADPVALGISVGLVAGKPLGIVGMAILARRTGIGHLPASLDNRHLIGLGLLAGIGFTMSTFIAGLALDGPRLELAKIAIMGASLVAAALGFAVLRMGRPR